MYTRTHEKTNCGRSFRIRRRCSLRFIAELRLDVYRQLFTKNFHHKIEFFAHSHEADELLIAYCLVRFVDRWWAVGRSAVAETGAPASVVVSALVPESQLALGSAAGSLLGVIKKKVCVKKLYVTKFFGEEIRWEVCRLKAIAAVS